MNEEAIDVLVIGSGAAGGALTWRTNRKRCKGGLPGTGRLDRSGQYGIGQDKL